MTERGGSAEDRLIADYFRPLVTHPGALGLGDDAALLTPPPGYDLVLTTDGVISGVHFFPNDAADAIARKALRMNLSDLAAKGAAPLGFLLSVALAKNFESDWLAEFARGLAADIETYGIALLGGDTDRTPGLLSVSITAVGSVPAGTMVRRSTARPGDCIFVSGSIGDAALGLVLRDDAAAGPRWRLSQDAAGHLASRYLLPQPRNALADAVRLHASAAMDVSDGLAGDLAKLCRASGVTATIDAARVPLSDAARAVVTAEPAMLETVFSGGDDYEILCSVAPNNAAAFRAAAQDAGVPVTTIGAMAAGSAPPRILGADGQPLVFRRPAFSHF